MNCHDVQQSIIYDSIDSRVIDHMTRCSECRHLYYEVENTLINWNLQNANIPEKNLYSSVMRRLDTSGGRKDLSWFHQVANYAAILVVGLFIGMLVLKKVYSIDQLAAINKKDPVEKLMKENHLFTGSGNGALFREFRLQ